MYTYDSLSENEVGIVIPFMAFRADTAGDYHDTNSTPTRQTR
jgi:hypothetical protein